jgi:hypothetical protein
MIVMLGLQNCQVGTRHEGFGRKRRTTPKMDLCKPTWCYYYLIDYESSAVVPCLDSLKLS